MHWVFLCEIRELWLHIRLYRAKKSSHYLWSIYDWKLILSNIAMVFSKQDHLGFQSQGLLRNIGWTLLGSCACLLFHFSLCWPKDIRNHYVQPCHHCRFMREINDSIDGFKNSEALSRCFPQNIIPFASPKSVLSQRPSTFGTLILIQRKQIFFF